MERSQQLDLVIVVNRLLTGFDAPCLSTLYMDRSPMSPQDIIQAFQERIVCLMRIRHMDRL